MLREQLIKKEIGSGTFRWCSHEISRIERLSDAFFGFRIEERLLQDIFENEV